MYNTVMSLGDVNVKSFLSPQHWTLFSSKFQKEGILTMREEDEG